MSKIVIPPGHVLLRTDDLADLLGSRPEPIPASGASSETAGQATTPALAEAISLVFTVKARQATSGTHRDSPQ